MVPIKERARRYLAQMPQAISGQGGHTATFNAAVVLVKGFALDESAAMELLAGWNTSHCKPLWSTGELRHKIQSAAQTDRAVGYLLTSGQEMAFPTPRPLDDKAAQRALWPAFDYPPQTALDAIAALRGLPMAAVELCARNGFVRTARLDGHDCFVITEQTFAQARRLDGEPLKNHAGKPIKAKNLRGSEGAFIGQKWLGETPAILLVEGAVGMLEAIAALYLVDRMDWTVLAATSASSRFCRDPGLLKNLRGRRVRILPDPDETGLEAAATWLANMEDAGAKVDAVSLPSGIKDLGDFLTRHNHDLSPLTEIFSL